MPLSQALLNWYDLNARPLPWRLDSNPYKVWISEIMLQQTRVETVIPYYLRWMERFPDVRSVAEAELEEVLRWWEGLGYYARARNLHRTARLLCAEHACLLPESVDALRKLPGIGRYSAGAIASIAFGSFEPALDGNIRRILARLSCLDRVPSQPNAQEQLAGLARSLLPSNRAGDFNQALMDLGATICLPRKPRCADCPLAAWCLAFQREQTGTYPLRRKRKALPLWVVAAAVIRKGDTVLLAQRPAEGLLGGLWEYPGGKVEEGESLQACLVREIREELAVSLAVGAPFGVFHHAFTHFKVELHAFEAAILSGTPQPLAAQQLRWQPIAELQALPMGKIDRQISRQLIEQSRPVKDCA